MFSLNKNLKDPALRICREETVNLENNNGPQKIHHRTLQVGPNKSSSQKPSYTDIHHVVFKGIYFNLQTSQHLPNFHTSSNFFCFRQKNQIQIFSSPTLEEETTWLPVIMVTDVDGWIFTDLPNL